MASLLKEFEKDCVYAPFLKEEFDPQTHASHLVQGVVIAEHLNKLSIGINKLENEIESQVCKNYEDLLSQATGVETLEDVLNTMHGRIQTLQAGVERLRGRIVEPYNQIAQQTLILGRLQSACELLRRIIRCLSLSQRLQEQLANGPKDITKAATSLKELDDINKSSDLSGIEILEKDHRMIKKGRSEVEKQATVMMDKGMELQNQSQVGTALQVFHNLGTLCPSVEKVLENLVKKLNHSVTAALDVNYLTQLPQATTRKGGAPGKAIMPTIGQSAQFRANLWAGLEKLMDDIYDICMKTSHLHKVLSKKKDSTTHECFLDEVYKQSEADLFTRVWRNVTTILAQEFDTAAKGSNFIRQALEVDYPKLVRLYGDLWKKLEVISTDIRAAQTQNFQNPQNFHSTQHYGEEYQNENTELENFDPQEALRKSLVPLEKAYISRSLSRLFDAVNLMFSTPGVVPSKDEIDTLIKTITSELNISAIDRSLSERVVRNVVKTIQLFCQKCEHIVVTDGEASQVIGPPTPGQSLNSEVVNQLSYVRGQIERMATAILAHLPPPVCERLIETLPGLDQQVSCAVSPLFSSLRDSTEAIVLTMHNEDFSGSEDPSSSSSPPVAAPCSLYMRELQTFFSRVAKDYIEPFAPSDVIHEQVVSLCRLSLDLLVRHASLVRPVGDQGKMRLAADFAQMELALSPLSPRPSDLGKPYRILRAYRPLLFQTPPHISTSTSIGTLIPHSTILHSLFARASTQMRSPHQTAGWSPSRYSNWLDDHRCERERLGLVEGALEAYVTGVKAKHLSTFDPVYPVMKELLENGLVFCGGRKN